MEGLVDVVVAEGELMEAAKKLALELAGSSLGKGGCMFACMASRGLAMAPSAECMRWEGMPRTAGAGCSPCLLPEPDELRACCQMHAICAPQQMAACWLCMEGRAWGWAAPRGCCALHEITKQAGLGGHSSCCPLRCPAPPCATFTWSLPLHAVVALLFATATCQLEDSDQYHLKTRIRVIKHWKPCMRRRAGKCATPLLYSHR